MLMKISEFPTDKRIAGIHSIPITDDGSIVMVWDKNERGLTTVGGRIEGNETLHEALDRETVEEAGLILKKDRYPIAAWYWSSTDTYTVFCVAQVDHFVPIPLGFETTGRVIFNFETARQMITKIEGDGERIQILDLAEERVRELHWSSI